MMWKKDIYLGRDAKKSLRGKIKNVGKVINYKHKFKIFLNMIDVYFNYTNII